MFKNKKDADEHDKMLELAECITALIEKHLPDIQEGQAEAVGVLLSKRRDILMRAIKGKPDLLLEEEPEPHNGGDVFAPPAV
jgi:uncharacterized protein